MNNVQQETIIFSGPTLSRADVQRLSSNVVWHPPAIAGDLLQAQRQGFKHIILVDGQFGKAASVWHKEIIYLLAKGIHITGIASLGALRAIECQPYGMKAHGQVVDFITHSSDFDDADVMVNYIDQPVHIATTLAHVNVALNMLAWQQAGYFTDTQTQWILDCSRQLYYQQRTLITLCKKIEEKNAQLSKTFKKHMQENYVDYKQQDVIHYLTTAYQTDEPLVTKKPTFNFEWSSTFKNLLAHSNTTTLRYFHPNINNQEKLLLCLHYHPTLYKLTIFIARYVEVLSQSSYLQKNIQLLATPITRWNNKAVELPTDAINKLANLIENIMVVNHTNDKLYRAVILQFSTLYYLLINQLDEKHITLNASYLKKIEQSYLQQKQLTADEKKIAFIKEKNICLDDFKLYINCMAHTNYFIMMLNYQFIEEYQPTNHNTLHQVFTQLGIEQWLLADINKNKKDYIMKTKNFIYHKSIKKQNYNLSFMQNDEEMWLNYLGSVDNSFSQAKIE